MRPLAVLILVLGAIASLVFALLSLTGESSRGTAVARDIVTKPALAKEVEPGGDLELPVEPATRLAATRTETPLERSADRGAHTGAISGVVVDVEDYFLQDVELTLIRRAGGPLGMVGSLDLTNGEDPPVPLGKTKSSPLGEFRFEGIAPADDYVIVASHRSYNRKEVGPISVAAKGVTQERIQMEWGLAVYGRVIDKKTRAPIDGAVLEIDNPMASFLPSTRKSETVLETVTDEFGVYSFENIGAGQKMLTVKAEGFATVYFPTFSADLRTKTNEFKKAPVVWKTNRQKQLEEIRDKPNEVIEWLIEMETGQMIAGRVLDPDRNGLSGVMVTAINQSGSVGSRGDAVTTEGGEYMVEGLGPGIYTLVTDVKGYESTPLQRISVGSTGVDIVLEERGSVSGRAVDAVSGRTLSNFVVKVRTLHPRNLSWGGVVGRAKVRDSTNGSFSVDSITEGDYVVEGTARGYASTFSEPFRVEQGEQTTDVVVRLTKGGSIRGKVLDVYTNKPVVGAEVATNENNHVESELMTLLNSMGGQTATSKLTTKTNSDGEFLFSLMTPETYQVRIKKPGYTEIIKNNVKVGDGSGTNLGTMFLKKGAIVTGTVFDHQGQPIAGANIVMRSIDEGDYSTYSARSDANGRYKVRNASPGRYSLSASRPAGPNASPFAPVVDLRHSEIEIRVFDSERYAHDLHLGGRAN
jgi:protocatechuate 3,4-dioxygenase beta subunit